MANTAQEAKDKGNAAFKVGNYPHAIGHYTTAILADRNDPIFYLNRAAAYLKLGKNEDAERDSSTVLTFNALNVKALFRRGQARVGMGKFRDALGDFKEALKHEPTNESVKQELETIEGLIEKEMAKKIRIGQGTPIKPSSTDASPKRRRIPINIVGPMGRGSRASAKPPQTEPFPTLSANKDGQGDLLIPVSSQPLTSIMNPAPIPAASTTQSLPSGLPPPLTSTPNRDSFTAAKLARENAKPSRIGGGIFRASGDSAIFNRESTQLSSHDMLGNRVKTAPFSAATNQLSTKSPMTLFNFTKVWESSSKEGRWQLISGILPSSFPAMFQTSLEPSILVSIMDTFLAALNRTQGDDHTACVVKEFMDAFTKVPRFGTVMLFLNKREKEVVREVWGKLGITNADGVWNVVY